MRITIHKQKIDQVLYPEDLARQINAVQEYEGKCIFDRVTNSLLSLDPEYEFNYDRIHSVLEIIKITHDEDPLAKEKAFLSSVARLKEEFLDIDRCNMTSDKRRMVQESFNNIVSVVSMLIVEKDHPDLFTSKS